MVSKKPENGKYTGFKITWKAMPVAQPDDEPRKPVNCSYSFNGFGILPVDEDMRLLLKHLLLSVDLELGKDCVSCPLHGDCYQYAEGTDYIKMYLRPGQEPCKRLESFLEHGGTL
jgi:hypothetical protein